MSPRQPPLPRVGPAPHTGSKARGGCPVPWEGMGQPAGWAGSPCPAVGCCQDPRNTRVGAQPSANTPLPESLWPSGRTPKREGAIKLPLPHPPPPAGRAVLLLPWFSGKCPPRGPDFQTPLLTDALVPHSEAHINPLISLSPGLHLAGGGAHCPSAGLEGTRPGGFPGRCGPACLRD